MRIKHIINQNRRDFNAIYECEFCGKEVKDRGYDDSYFHNDVIPNKICPDCGKSSGVPTSKATNPDWMRY